MEPKNAAMETTPLPRLYSLLCRVVLSRLRVFYRWSEAVLWVYGFPVLMLVALGIAFRNRPVEQITVDIAAGADAERIRSQLAAHERFLPQVHDPATSRQ